MATIERAIPVLTYQDIAGAHDFLVRAFGFVSGGVHRTPDGQAVHGEVRAGDAPIWLHRVTAEHQLNSPLRPYFLRAFFGTNARKRRGLSTMILCNTSSLAPAAFNFGTNTVKVFA